MVNTFLNSLKLVFLALVVCNSTLNAKGVVLVTGGAGYIGSHICKALKDEGYTPVVYDSLAIGSQKSVKWGPLIIGDLLDTEKLGKTFDEFHPIAVIHLAGYSNVGESVEEPAKYYQNNIIASLNLLNVMHKYRVRKLIFSSSGTVYGENNHTLIKESCTKGPTNPYAFSKLVIERAIEDFAKAYGIIKFVIFRYFNAAGVDFEAGLKRSPESHFLIPKALKSLDSCKSGLKIFGTDYPTKDGTPIRDYIHVKDIAQAHVSALYYLQAEKESVHLNLGTGKGYSVLDIIQTIEKVTEKKVSFEVYPRRKGDLASTVADVCKVKRVLEFEPKYSDLNVIVESEWVSLEK